MLAIPAIEISDANQIAAEPLVSVIVVTYNHEAYIAQAIEGILAQKCNFPFELIIGEDKSQDKTLAICLDYQKRYPHIIRIVTWQENVGLNANYFRAWGRARGKYVALLEGDDFWTDSAKLAKQVAFMEKYPDTILCGAQVMSMGVVNGEFISLDNKKTPKLKSEYRLEDFLSGAYFHTSAHLFRTKDFKIPACALSSPCIDAILLPAAAIQGKVRCIPDQVSVYRIHMDGFKMGLTEEGRYEFDLEMTRALKTFLGESYLPMINRREDVERSWLCHVLASKGQMQRARKLAGETLLPLALHAPKQAFLLLFHICLPRTYQIVFKACNSVKPHSEVESTS